MNEGSGAIVDATEGAGRCTVPRRSRKRKRRAAEHTDDPTLLLLAGNDEAICTDTVWAALCFLSRDLGWSLDVAHLTSGYVCFCCAEHYRSVEATACSAMRCGAGRADSPAALGPVPAAPARRRRQLARPRRGDRAALFCRAACAVFLQRPSAPGCRLCRNRRRLQCAVHAAHSPRRGAIGRAGAPAMAAQRRRHVALARPRALARRQSAPRTFQSAPARTLRVPGRTVSPG